MVSFSSSTFLPLLPYSPLWSLFFFMLCGALGRHCLSACLSPAFFSLRLNLRTMANKATTTTTTSTMPLPKVVFGTMTIGPRCTREEGAQILQYCKVAAAP